MKNRLIIIGAGGFSVVVADAAIEMGYSKIDFVDDVKPLDTKILGNFKIIGKQDAILKIEDSDVELVIAIGNCKIREEIYTKYSSQYKFANIIHPKATVCRLTKIGNGNIILAGATINANASLGDNNIINSNVLIDHDSEIGNHCHIAQGTIIGSNVTINNGVLTELAQKVNSFSKI
ncbi:MAG: hypothetical protein RQ875_06170 [Vicingaceae bacterium]|nr:hypothetical protein [Vicingaceae bacterium]